MRMVASGSPGPQELRARGVILPVLVVTGGRTTLVPAMWDTGSDVTSVDRTLLQDMGAPQSGSIAIYTVAGPSSVGDYMAAIDLPTGLGGSVRLSDGPIPVLGDALNGHVRVLIGREIQAGYRLVVDGPAGRWAIYRPDPAPAGAPARGGSLVPAACIAGLGGVVFGLTALLAR